MAEGESKRGRPTLYKKEYNEQARKLCLLGYTDKDLADFWEIETATINNWKKQHPDFFAAMRAGKEEADAKVADALYNRAIGFEHDSEEIKVVSNGDGMGSSVERVPVRKVYPPDFQSMSLWLRNRQHWKWKDKVETEHTGTIDHVITGMEIK